MLLAVATVAVAGGCSSSHHATPPVKANGCTAKVTGHAGADAVVTYSVSVQQPPMVTAIQQAVQTWNRSGAHVVLTEAAAGGTINFVSTAKSTHTDACARVSPRSVTIYLGTKTFAKGGTADKPLANLVAREIGHALGLAKAGPCGALMTTACSRIAAGPDAAEAAEVAKLYAPA